MFLILSSLFAGFLGSLIAACIIQYRTDWYKNVGFPSMAGGVLAAVAVSVLAAVTPSNFAHLGIIAPVVGLLGGAGCTFLAKPMIYDYLRRKENSKNGGR